MPNSYVTLTTLKSTGGLNFTGTAYDSRLLALSESVSREIDAYCNRYFYVVIETRWFDGPDERRRDLGLPGKYGGFLSIGGTRLDVPDLLAIGTLLEDTNRDGTFETTWATSDYLLWPYNAAPTSEWGSAYKAVIVNYSSNGSKAEFYPGQRNYRIDGTWGYRLYTEDTGERGSGTLDSTSTLLVLTTAGTLSVGQTILIEAEFMYIKGTGTGATMTVSRGLNGSVPTAHSTGTVRNLAYPGEITEAAMIQTGRILKRRESGFASTVGLPETGQMFVYSGGLDSDVKQLISRYRKIPV